MKKLLFIVALLISIIQSYSQSITISVSSTNEYSNTLLGIQSKDVLSQANSWETIAVHTTNFSINLPINQSQRYFRGIAYQTNSIICAWAHPANEEVEYYKLYFGPQSQNYSGYVSSTNFNSTPISLSAGTNYLVVTAMGTNGRESEPSNEIIVNMSYDTPIPPQLSYLTP